MSIFEIKFSRPSFSIRSKFSSFHLRIKFSTTLQYDPPISAPKCNIAILSTASLSSPSPKSSSRFPQPSWSKISPSSCMSMFLPRVWAPDENATGICGIHILLVKPVCLSRKYIVLVDHSQIHRLLYRDRKSLVSLKANWKRSILSILPENECIEWQEVIAARVRIHTPFSTQRKFYRLVVCGATEIEAFLEL